MRELLVLLPVFCCSINAHTQQWNWAASAGGGGNTDFCHGIATDSQGNVYWAGSVSGTAEFGCGTLSPGSTVAGFIAKRGPDGTCSWVRGITVSFNDAWVYGITIDAEDRIYVTGSYDGNATFGNGITLSSLGSDAIFLARYTSDGDCLWARRAGNSSSSAEGRGVAVSADGGVFVTGFSGGGTISFDDISIPNPGNSRQVVIARYDSLGTVQWARASAGTGQSKSSRSISIAGDRLFITGQASGATTTFDGLPLGSGASGAYLYVLACDLQGNALWSRGYGNGDHQGMGIAADTLGNVFVAGRMWGSFITPLDTLASVSSNDDILLLALDSDGNHRWARSAGSAQRDLGWAVTADGQGNVYAAMQFNNTIDLLGTSVTALGGEDVLIAKVDNAGELVWLSRPSGFQRDIPLCIHREASAPHRLHFGGYFWGAITYGNTTIDDVQNGDAMVVSGIDTTLHVSTYGTGVCSGLCLGEAIAFVNGEGPFTYAWSNSANSQEIGALCPGEYSVIVTDANGNTAEGAVSISNNVDPQLAINVDGDSLWVEGGEEWLWYFGGQPISTGAPHHIAESSGSYHLDYIDGNGCLWTAGPVIVVLNVGMEEAGQKQLHLFPNPATEVISINGPYTPILGAVAVDVLGREAQVSITGSNSVDVRHLAPGSWTLRVTTGSGVHISRFVKE